VEELQRQQHASGLCNSQRRSAQMLLEEPPQLALADPEAFGQTFDTDFIERTGFDER
jgi:hypothetical protein